LSLRAAGALSGGEAISLHSIKEIASGWEERPALDMTILILEKT
jgi:hypothetical protein